MADAAVAVDEAPARSAQLYIADMTADLEVLVGEVSDEYIKAMTEVIGKLTIDADISLEASSSEVREVERPRTRGGGCRTRRWCRC